jgi:hypothetical protein
MELNYWQHSWPLDRERCPCDFHFVEYLAERGAGSKSIFHFGSGEHHQSEHAAYVELIIRNPEIAKYYKVLFGDIYTLSAAVLLNFDFVTLFHLCEFYDSAKSAYARHDDESLLELFLCKLKPGGRILFYRRSSAFAKARSIIQDCLSSGRLVEEEDYRSLLICKAGPGAPAAGSNLVRPARKAKLEPL